MGKEIVKVIKLSEPLQTANGEVKELKFRTARAGDFRGVSMPPKLGELFDAAGKMCGLLSTEVDALTMKDAMAVANFLGECMEDSQAIGS